MKPHTISSTAAARTFSELLNRVHYQGRSFDIKRGRTIVARIVPPAPSMSTSELKTFLTQLPRLDKADIQAFEETIKSIRSDMKPEENPWD